MQFGCFPSDYSSCLSLELLSALQLIPHSTNAQKHVTQVGKKKTLKPTATSPKQLRLMTKDGLRSLLSGYQLPTTGTRPQLLQLLTNCIKSKRSPKRLCKTKFTRIQADQAGSITPRTLGHHSTNADSEPSGSERSPTNAKNSDSESSDSESSH